MLNLSGLDAGKILGFMNRFGIGEPLASLLTVRSIEADVAESYLSPTPDKLYPPFLLKGMKDAVDVFFDVFSCKSRIRVFGDYDADGVTSTVILVHFLRELGLEADFYIPHRVDEGYGLSEASVLSAVDDGISLVITVDCGISHYDEILHLVEKGVTVIVLDHHEAPELLPPANAIVNPHQPECNYPFKDLAGVGVVFKFLQAVCEKLAMPFPDKYLPLVAIGTVADVMPLLSENRVFVSEGLKKFELCEHYWIGLDLLADKSCRLPLDARNLGFFIAPKINAAGRIGHAAMAVELLLEKDPEAAEQLLSKLLDLNKQRQKIEEKIRREIIFRLQDEPGFSDAKIAVIDGDDWHPGVIGITAAKLSDFFSMPVFIISVCGQLGRGSARGTDGYNIYAILESHKELFEDFGGHVCAGGFSIKKENIPLLKERIRHILPQHQELEKKRDFDFESSFSMLDLKNVSQLAMSAPYGEGNGQPLLFFRAVKIADASVVGKQNHLRLKMVQDGVELKGIYFRKGTVLDRLNINELLYDIIAAPVVEIYNGRSFVSLVIESILIPEPAADNFSAQENSQFPQPFILDARNTCNRISYIRDVISSSDSTAILVRTPQQKKKLEFILDGAEFEEISAPRAPVISFFKDVDSLMCCDDIILFYPPPSLNHFSSSFYKEARKIHFLFTKEDLSLENSLQKVAQPTVGRLEKIRKFFESGNCVSASELVSMIGDDTIKPVTAEIALKILNELRIVINDGGRFMLKSYDTVTDKSLIASKLFESFSLQRKSFEIFEQLYNNSFDQLKLEILSLI